MLKYYIKIYFDGMEPGAKHMPVQTKNKIYYGQLIKLLLNVVV
jgi:hypothetical protein